MDGPEVWRYSHLQRFQDEGYNTWIKTTMFLYCLKTRLAIFLENETDVYHEDLRNKTQAKTSESQCQNNCNFKNWKPNQIPKTLCLLCRTWRDEIWNNHDAKHNQVYWNNCTPYMWPTHKWEVAKVYMPRGVKNHKSVDDFDISSFLNFMSFCHHFRTFVETKLLAEVTNVRNNVMHSATFEVTPDNFKLYIGRVRALGEALEKRIPDFKISKDLDEIQNIDLSLHFTPKIQHQSYSMAEEQANNVIAQRVIDTELKIMKEKMTCLVQLYDDEKEDRLTSGELQNIQTFLHMNPDLLEKLAPQLQRLEAVQTEHGQQIDVLTDKVDKLEKKSLIPDGEFSTNPIMYKNRLLEHAQRWKWPAPIFSETVENPGYRGRVEVNGHVFQGSQVCGSKIQAHQEVAKKALEELSSMMANDEAASGVLTSQAQPADVLFFVDTGVFLNMEVCPDEGCSNSVEKLESAYNKLVHLFGLEPPTPGLSNKERVLQYCQKLNVPPPAENDCNCCTLRLNGQITFYDLEGCKQKKQAMQQAAKSALNRLTGVLKEPEVFQNNYIGALKELLEQCEQEKPFYHPKESQDGAGERVGWLPSQDTGGQAPRGGGSQAKEEECGEGRSEAEAPEGPLKRTCSHCDHVPRGGRFVGCVHVFIKKELQPCKASDQEGAVKAAYHSLMEALSLSPAACTDGEKQSVLEFFKWTQCCPPVEVKGTDTNGMHTCFLKVDGKLIFHSLERMSSVKDAEQLAAQVALKHLEGLQTVNSIKLHGKEDYKCRLQEVAAKLGNIALPIYLSTDRGTEMGCQRFLGCVQVTIQKELQPFKASDQEGAVKAAYCSLMEALSLSPAACTDTDGERRAVLEFFTQTNCHPPEENKSADEEAHMCSLKINGCFDFHSPEGTSTKKETDKLAAKEALRHLEGLLAVKTTKLPDGGNYKGRLQELVSGLWSGPVPTYSFIDGSNPHIKELPHTSQPF